jgi:hypothetical protein
MVTFNLIQAVEIKTGIVYQNQEIVNLPNLVPWDNYNDNFKSEKQIQNNSNTERSVTKTHTHRLPRDGIRMQ